MPWQPADNKGETGLPLSRRGTGLPAGTARCHWQNRNQGQADPKKSCPLRDSSLEQREDLIF